MRDPGVRNTKKKPIKSLFFSSVWMETVAFIHVERSLKTYVGNKSIFLYACFFFFCSCGDENTRRRHSSVSKAYDNLVRERRIQFRFHRERRKGGIRGKESNSSHSLYIFTGVERMYSGRKKKRLFTTINGPRMQHNQRENPWEKDTFLSLELHFDHTFFFKLVWHFENLLELSYLTHHFLIDWKQCC